MIYKMKLADSVDEMIFDLLEVPIEDKDIEGTADNTTIDGNVFTDYLWLKKQFIQKWSLMCEDDYTQLRGFYTRQWENAEVPTYKMWYGEDVSSTATASGNPITLTNDTDYPAQILDFGIKGNAEQTKLPSEYQQLDYIENTDSTLTPYIETNVELGASDFEISAGVKFTASTGTESPILSIWTSTYGYWNLFKSGNNIDCYTQAHHVIYGGATDGTWFDFNLKRVGNDWTLADGVHTNTTWVYSPSTINLTTLKINARGDLSTGYKTCAQYSYVKIIVAGELVRDYVPAKRISDGKIGFYDLINNNFVVSIGTNDFTAGNNAPNPDFPIEVKTVKGEQTLSINANEFNVLLDSPTSANMIKMSDFEVGGLWNGDWSADMQRITNANHPIQCEPSTQYTLSVQLVPPVLGMRCGIHECSANGTFIQDLGWKQLATTPFTFTTGSTTGSLKFVFSSSTTSTTVTTGSTEDTTTFSSVDAFMRGCSFRLDEGATALTPIELAKIGTYQDRIYKDDGKWYVEKQIGKVVLDGSESAWRRAQFGSTGKYYYTFGASWGQQTTNGKLVLSDYFKAKNTWSEQVVGIWLDANIILTTQGSLSDSETLSDFKTWLASNPTTVYYALATPTTTEITEQALINQLEAIVSAYLPRGAVNISLTGTGAQGSMVLDYKLIISKETIIKDTTPVRLTLTDGGVINPCGCRQNIQLTMRETIQ